MIFHFDLENKGDTAHNIKFIAILNDSSESYFVDNLKTSSFFGPEDATTIDVPLRIKFNSKVLKLTLYIIYDTFRGTKHTSWCRQFDFIILDVNTAPYVIQPRKNYPAKEISSFMEFLPSIVNLSRELSKDENTIIIPFITDSIKTKYLIIAGNMYKEITFNTVDSMVYFKRPYNDEFMIVIGKKIDKNYGKYYHMVLATWSDTSTSLMVDGQEIINDKKLRKQINEHPDVVLSDMGLYFFNHGDYRNAMIHMEKSLEYSDTNQAKTYGLLFLCYEKFDRIRDGINILEKAIQVGHKDSTILLDLARAYESVGDNQKAIQTYLLDHQNSGSITGFARHINLQNNNRNYKGSLILIREGLRRYPHNSGILNNFGITLLGLGDTITARRAFRDAVKYDPNGEIGLNNLKLLDSLENSKNF